MLTIVNRKGDLSVVKRHHNGTVYEYQVVDSKAKPSVLARFPTKWQADEDMKSYHQPQLEG